MASDSLLPSWSDVALHARLKRALLSLGYVSPTDIQRRAIPGGLNGKDIVGVAETVS
jgi:superfamily II DNA/RNA helicase